MQLKSSLVLLISFLTISVAASDDLGACIGTNRGMLVPSSLDTHYRNLRDRFTNCSYVDGNLELSWLYNNTMDLSFLKNIREVTGYVLISYVHVRNFVLPQLQIIRGQTLFKKKFALLVTVSSAFTLELPALREVLWGSVRIQNKYYLCHVKTINWGEIITGVNATFDYVYDFTREEPDCPRCHSSCEEGCWGEGPENCQKFSKTMCSPLCAQGRCFGRNPWNCCHTFCAGGCTGPLPSQCLACRNFNDEGVCSQECPPMEIYNLTTYSWETNPNGKYVNGATCVRNCPEHMLKENGACVKSCSPNKTAVYGECSIPCKNGDPKNSVSQIITLEATTDSVDTWVHVGWTLPHVLPDSYTVSLLTEKYGNLTIVIPGNQSKVVFRNVKAEGTFYVSIQARFDKTGMKMKTLAQFPETPQNVTVEAIKDSGDTWEVHVGWTLPRVLPDSYTVSLLTEKYGNHTTVIPGNPSEVVFKNVKAEGTYYVSIQARLGKASIKMRKLAQFPDERTVPHFVTVEAIKDSADTWEVHVGWELPRVLPDSYTVELLTYGKYGNHTIVIAGNASEVVFRDVKGEGNYEVVIQASLGDTITATSSRRARFPDATHTITIILSTLGVVLVLVGIVCIAIWTRRNRAGTTQALPATAHRFEPFYPNMLFRRECDREIAEIEQHVYEEVGPPIYDVIAPSICSYEEIAPTYEEINPSHDEGIHSPSVTSGLIPKVKDTGEQYLNP